MTNKPRVGPLYSSSVEISDYVAKQKSGVRSENKNLGRSELVVPALTPQTLKEL